MSRFRNVMAAIVLLLAISTMTLMPVVRSFYGEGATRHIHISTSQASSSQHYLGRYVRNMSWSIIKYRQLAMPYLGEIKLQPTFIVLFLCSLLSFIASIHKRVAYVHPLFKNKPLLNGPAYLQHCLLLI
ncbi:hypothetical protein C8P68_103319 [Mucilaginibacter yixingensis]|uniref:Uncharacterized protein n=1 Tax=Mucilaginibacter yixingensis TaxID=1295612 RepID=A0A2T5JBK7_9SPHI|nr:hypothetical protein [Mucilaginibacter yixingensis]PTQ98159.1 hypothetical protein C8P68_103319 [Mucilaginibacter yixingensis]